MVCEREDGERVEGREREMRERERNMFMCTDTAGMCRPKANMGYFLSQAVSTAPRNLPASQLPSTMYTGAHHNAQLLTQCPETKCRRALSNRQALTLRFSDWANAPARELLFSLNQWRAKGESGATVTDPYAKELCENRVMAGDQSDVGQRMGEPWKTWLVQVTTNLSVQDGRVNCCHISKTSVFKT